ncbi:hypothetical protein [Candidatus Nitrospira bockiana]
MKRHDKEPRVQADCSERSLRSWALVEACPRCHRNSLVQTGAFWSCRHCFYAITHTALRRDQAERSTDPRPR